MAQVGGDDQAGLFVQLAEEMEQQGTTDLAKGQIAQLIEDEQIDMHQPVGQAPLLAVELFLLENNSCSPIAGEGLHVGHFWMRIMGASGSTLDANPQPDNLSRYQRLFSEC